MRITLILIISILLCSCYPLKTSYDYDLLTDFSNFNTYSFSSKSQQYMTSINGPRFFAAIDTEMRKRGFKKAGDPDVVIDIYIKNDEKEKTVVSYDGASQWSSGYGVGFKVNEVSTEKYAEGTVFINMLDEHQKKIVWQVRATKLLQLNNSPNKRQKNIDLAVAKMFKHYPFQMKSF
jgi:hypothetical protein